MHLIEDIYELSPAQQGMFFHTLSAQTPEAQFQQLSCTIHADLDVPSFARAWQHLVDRHPVLRSSFYLEDLDRPVQVVQQHVRVALRSYDWRGLPRAAQQVHLAGYLKADQRRGFDLASAPLMRLALIQLGPREYEFVWSRHHILLDGWSVAVLLKEVFALYDALRRGADLQLAPARPYRDYVAWLRRQDPAAAEAFWRGYLAGFEAPLRLGHPMTQHEGAQYAEQVRRLPTSTTGALQSLARRHQLTLNTLTLGAWALLLRRVCAAQDVVFGTTVAGRPTDLAGIETMVGMFINTFPVRAQVADDEALLPWLARLQAEQALLRRYDYSPLAQIQRWSALPPGQPLFESLVVFENYPFDGAALSQPGRLTISQVRGIGARTPYPLALLALPGEEFELQLIYDPRRFDRQGVDRLLDDLQDLFARIATASERPIAAQLGQIAPPAAPGEAPPLAAKSRMRERAARESAFVAPRTPIEARLAELWSELLGVAPVGAADQFFELGGHSLAATELMARVYESFGVSLPLSSLFAAPRLAGLAEQIAQQLARAPEQPLPALPTLTPDLAGRHQPFPLTDIQQAYLVGRSGAFALGDVGSHSYLEFESAELDLARFNHALQRLIERHDMLRAIMLPDGRQQILEQVPPYRIELLDLRGADEVDAATQLESVRRRMSHQVLRVDQWPLFEVRATRLDERRLRLHISTDALIRDAWSVQILASELIRLYQEPDASLAPLEVSFRDYVLAEIALRETELYRRALEYWRRRAPLLRPAPELPLAQDPGALKHARFTRRSAELEPAVWRELKRRAAQVGVTPSGALLAAFSEVLATWSKSPRFTITLTLFNRLPLHPQVNAIVGDFTATTLLAVDAAGATFELRARRLQEQLWEDLDHRYVGGVRVARELMRASGGAAPVAVPVVFTSTLTQTAAGQTGPEALGEVVYTITQTPQVWLDHQVSEHAGALVFNWDAVEELFPAGLLDDMFGVYCQLLRRLAGGSGWQATTLDLVPLAQLAQRALVNATAASLPHDLLHCLFASEVLRRPAQPAVIAGERTLSYAELDRRARRVGGWLRRLGARPNRLVAVVMEKGWEQIVAVLGVLESGATYLPIDPGLPRERLWYLLERGAVELALTQSWIDQALDWPAQIRRLRVDEAAPADEDEPPLEPLQAPADLAYVIYTSGSTGQPKGVMIDHRAAANTLLDINARFGVGPDDRVLALSSLSFDLSVYDIFGTLAAGATIVLPAARRDPADWLELIHRERVTIWDSVPALMQLLVDHAAERGERLPASLRLVMLSGDWIPLALSRQIGALGAGAAVVSLGGATEAAIWSILHPITAIDAAWKSIPYGKPMLNQQLYVLNELLEPCPVWVPGQLYIGGVGLARGYLGQPDLTATAFVPNPFVTNDERRTTKDEPGPSSFVVRPSSQTRLYKTGDLGRYLPDGSIEFLGREDFQVKIRGYRIELGEIEATLRRHPAVRAAVAAAVGESQRDRRLVAYVVPDQELVIGLDAPPDGAAHASEAALFAPLQRLDFKLRQPGLRPDAPGANSIPLVRPALDEQARRAYAERRSYRAYTADPIPFEQFSALLGCLNQVELDEVPKQRYGSAGGLYPVQLYLYVKPDRVAGLPGGAYYYHPRDHRLVLLAAGAAITRASYAPVNQMLADDSAFSLFLVGQMSAIAPVYGDWARDFCLIEAGLITQLLETAAPAQQIGLCQNGGFDFAGVRRWFALEESQIYLHSLIGGRIDPARRADVSARAPARRASADSPPRWTRPALTHELRLFLQKQLPEYMVPAAIVLLDELPLTPNGKLDRKALPLPDARPAQARAAHQVPQTEAERTIAGVLQAVLQLEKVGLDDNFFDLGGTSVHLVQVHGKLRQLFERDIPMVELLKNPTIRALAAAISQEEVEQRQPPAEQLQERADRKKALSERQKEIRRRIR